MRENPAYMDLYAHLIGIKALERFYQFDTNKVCITSSRGGIFKIHNVVRFW